MTKEIERFRKIELREEVPRNFDGERKWGKDPSLLKVRMKINERWKN